MASSVGVEQDGDLGSPFDSLALRARSLRAFASPRGEREREASRMEAAGVELDRPFGSGRFCEFPKETSRMKNAETHEKSLGPPYCPQQCGGAGTSD